MGKDTTIGVNLDEKPNLKNVQKAAEDANETRKSKASDDSFYEKAYDLLKENGKSINRNILLIILLSFVLITISTGAISIEHSISFSGLTFSTPLWLILLGGAWIIAALYIYIISLTKYTIALQSKINDRYNKLRDYNHKFIGDHPIVSPNLVFMAVATMTRPGTGYIRTYSGIFNIIIFIIISSAFLFVPVTAQIVAYITLITLLNGAWWIWVSFFLLLVITVGDLIAFLISWFASDKAEDTSPKP